METLTIRRGASQIDVPLVSATEMKTQFGEMLDRTVAKGMVAIEKHGRTRAYLISAEEFERLNAMIPDPLAELREHYDVMVAQMQTPKHGAAVDALFDATPEQLGASAVAQAARTVGEQRKCK